MHPSKPTPVTPWPLLSALAVPSDAILWGDPETKSLTVMSRAQVEQALRTRVSEAVVVEVLAQLDKGKARPHFRKSVFQQESTFHIQQSPICNAPGGIA